ncbi:hypothetical protein YC2023_033438 [Brassica napus]
MPPVSGQSASCSRSDVRFTEEWSVCLSRGSCREEEATSIDAALCTSIDGDPRSYIHISIRAMKRGFLGPSRKEPAGLCTIHNSKREVSIDTLQAASIDSIHHQSIDTIHPTSIDKRQAAVIDRANKSSNNTVHRGTIHRGTVHPGTVHHNTIHLSTVHRDTIHRDTIYLPSIDTIQILSIDTIHVPSIDTVHQNTVHQNTVHRDTIHRGTIYLPSIDTVHNVSDARFTEEWSVCLSRGSCREEKATSIDEALCTSIDGDPRSREGRNSYQSPPGTPLIHLLDPGFRQVCGISPKL